MFVLDKHFQKSSDINELNGFILKGVSGVFGKIDFKITHADSRQNYLVNVADMSAGAILWKYRGKDKQFYDLIKENSIGLLILNRWMR